MENTEKKKTSAPSGSVDIVTVTPVVEKPKPLEVEKPVTRPAPIKLYKLNFRRPNGDVRSDISKSLVHTLASRWSDLLRLIPANRWSTLDDIVQLVWEWEKRQFRLLYPPRTRPQIETGVLELVEAGVVNIKT